jgi:hypothetical protein
MQDCGRTTDNARSNKIVGGQEAAVGEFPWQVG